MFHKDILKIYKEKFPMFSDDIFMWFPNGHNSIRLRFTSGFEWVFTYNTQLDWRLETVNSFVKTM